MFAGEWATLPNLLTMLRLALTPWIGLALARQDYRAALPMLVVAGATDAADGFLARRMGTQSALGAKLDPVADKFLAAVVFLALTANGSLPLWMLALVFGRDLLILSFGLWALRVGLGANLVPTIWGKLSTLLQLALAAGLILRPVLSADWLDGLNPVLLWMSAGMTLWSGLHYAWVGRNLIRHRRPPD